MNTAKSISRGRRLFPTKTAFIFETRSYTYEQLDQAINGVAEKLKSHGVTFGDRVALLFANDPRFVLAYYAAQRLGAIAVVLSAASTSEQLAGQLNDSGSCILLTSADLEKKVERAKVPTVERVCALDKDWEQAAALDTVEVKPETPATILYTSGTTGGQKGVTLSHGNLAFESQATADALRFTPQDCVLAFHPVSHSFTAATIMDTAFASCATLILQREFNAAKAVAAIAEHQVTVLPGVPAIFRILLDTAERSQLRSLRLCLSAAIRLPTDTADEWTRRFGSVINEGYGSTETCLSCFNHPLLYRPGSVGAPLAGIEIRVVAADGRECTAAELGEVQIRSEGVMLGYWGRERETEEVITDGWYRSGDLGFKDEDGYLFLTDRKKDVINCGGQKIFPSEVERIILTHPQIVEAAVFGVTNSLLGEELQVAVTLKSGVTGDSDTLVAHCRDRLPDWQQPQCVYVLDELPKGRSGKMLKRELRERAQSGSLRSSQVLATEAPAGLGLVVDSTSSAQTQALRRIVEIELAKLIGVVPDEQTPFQDAGLTSRQATQLAVALESALGQTVPITIAFQYPTLATLLDHLQSLLDRNDGPDERAGITAVSDAVVAGAPHIDAYLKHPHVITGYRNIAVSADYRSDVISTDGCGFRRSHDRQGIVDSESWFTREHRAILLGNSCAYGWGTSSDAATLPSLLNARERFSFLNLTMPAATSHQELIAALPYLAQTKLLLLVSGGSNLFRYLEFHPEQNTHGSFVGREFYTIVGQTEFHDILDIFRHDPQKSKNMPANAARALQTLQQAVLDYETSLKQWRETGWSEADINRRFEMAVAHHYRDLELLMRITPPGAQILYAMQPTSCFAKSTLSPEEEALFVVHQHYNTVWKQVYEPYAKDLLPAFTDAIRQHCERLGVPYTNLNQLDYDGWCFWDHGHLTDRGNAIIADFLGEWIEQLYDQPLAAGHSE